MEKYSNWRDKGTGISPFLPAEPTFSAVRKHVINPVVLALKWPVFVVLYLFASLAPKAATKLIFRWLFSIADIDLSVEGVRKSNIKEIEATKPAEGEIVVLNFVSPLDVLVIFLVSSVKSISSIIVVVPWDGGLYAFTAWQSLSILFQPLESLISDGSRIKGDIQKTLEGKLAIVFAEGTSSNNKAILPLQSQCAQLWSAGTTPVKVAVLRYYPTVISLPVPHMTKPQYVSKLLSSSVNSFVKTKIVPLRNPSLSACQTAFVENGLNKVELGVRDKVEFFKYFQNHSVGQ